MHLRDAQTLTIALLFYAPRTGRELRAILRSMGIRLSAVNFYHEMARLEDLSVVHGWSDTQVRNDVEIYTRRYAITPHGFAYIKSQFAKDRIRDFPHEHSGRILECIKSDIPVDFPGLSPEFDENPFLMTDAALVRTSVALVISFLIFLAVISYFYGKW